MSENEPNTHAAEAFGCPPLNELARIGKDGFHGARGSWDKGELCRTAAIRDAVAAPLLARIAELEEDLKRFQYDLAESEIRERDLEARVHKLLPKPKDFLGLYTVPELQARVVELEKERHKWVDNNSKLGRNLEESKRRITELEAEHTEAFTRIAELEAQLAAVQRVDPEAWKTPLEIDAGGGHTFRFSSAETNGDYGISLHYGNGSWTSFWLRPSQLAAAIPHIASYANAHGAPVDIGTNDALTQHLTNRCREIEAVLIPLNERLEKENAELRAKLEAPIADAKTLEALARVGWDAWHKDTGGTGPDETTWEINKPHEIAATAAILRAARPRVDNRGDYETLDALQKRYGWNSAALWDKINSRIRYGVELPPETPAPTDAQIEALAEADVALQIVREVRPTPTDAQIAALARVLCRAYEGSGSTLDKSAYSLYFRAQACAAYEYFGFGLTHCPNCGDRLHKAECDNCTARALKWQELCAKHEAELAAVTAERDAMTDKHREYIDLEVKEKTEHYTRLRSILQCSDSEHWLDAANRLVQERDALRKRFTRPIQANGVICDRCGVNLTARANVRVEGCEYVCPDCMTPAELIAFGVEASA